MSPSALSALHGICQQANAGSNQKLIVALHSKHCHKYRMRRILISAFLCCFLAGCGFIAASFWQFHQPIHLMAPKSVTIAPGSAKIHILQQLNEKGLAPSRYMMAAPLLLGEHPTLKAGEYIFEGSPTPAEVIDKIASGEVVIHKVTLPEGHTIRQLAAALIAEDKLSGALPELIEGAYLPETYHFTRGETRSELVARMKQAMDDALSELWKNRAENLPINTPQEALILASIVERETGIAEERGIVASVFTNRLRAGIPLQADPTVAYGVSQKLGRDLDRPLRTKDLQTDTPWNTYTRKGLPKTPIANPGLAALKATLNPDDTPYIYFVATGTGGHIFAESLKAHNRNVKAYRAKLRAQGKR